MLNLLTPKQVGRALNVSESSVKRWCDKGEIATQYTAGGHRRIALTSVLELVRSGKFALVYPDALGLPATSGQSMRVVERSLAELTEALLDGRESRCRQIVFDLYWADHSLSSICDEVIAAAFVAIGDRWSCGQAEVYHERRACEITLQILHQMRSLLPPASPDAYLAIGGAAGGDHYALGTSMAELVLRDCGWNAISLGDNLPFSTLQAAIGNERPRLFWLSCSHIGDPVQFLTEYAKLSSQIPDGVAIVVGGNALTQELRKKMSFASYGENMRQLESFARSLGQAIPADSDSAASE